MTTIRIGNDIHVRWSVFSRNGAPYVLDGAVIRLWLLSGPFKKRITDYSIAENVVSFLVDAKDLHRYGIYKLVLSLTDSASQTEDTAFDFTEVFQIVSKTYSGSTDAVLDGDVVVTPSSIIDNVVENYVTNAADGEDLTTVNNLLKFRDRMPGDGMGYVILRSNKTFAEQVIYENTIYEIRYDFDLDEATVAIPSGCWLYFVGGKIENGTLDGDFSTNGGDGVFDDVIVKDKKVYRSSWFTGTGLVESINASTETGRTIYIDSDFSLSKAFTLRSNDSVYGNKRNIISIIGVHDGFSPADGCIIKDVVFVGQGSVSDRALGYAEHAIAGAASNVTIDGCIFKNFYAMSPWIIYYRLSSGHVYENVIIRNCLFDGFGSFGDGVVGDAPGSVRAINMGNVTNVIVENNVFCNSAGDEDNDYVCITMEEEGSANFPNAIIGGKRRGDAMSVIRNNTFLQVGTGAIKVFASNVVIDGNTITDTDETYRGIIRIFNSESVSVTNTHVATNDLRNVLELQNCRNCFVGSMDVNSSASAIDNVIKLNGSEGITIADSSFVVKVADDATGYSYSGVVLLNNAKDIEIRNTILNVSKSYYVILVYGSNTYYGNLALTSVKIPGDVSIATNPFYIVKSESGAKMTIRCCDLLSSVTSQIHIDSEVFDSVLGGKFAFYNPLLMKNCNIVSIQTADDVKATDILSNSNQVYYWTVGGSGKVDISNLVFLASATALFDARNFSGSGTLSGIDIRGSSVSAIFLNASNADKFKIYSFVPDVQGITSGETANRPLNVVKGYKFFDSTLGKPIWYNGTGWIDATGTTV